MNFLFHIRNLIMTLRFVLQKQLTVGRTKRHFFRIMLNQIYPRRFARSAYLSKIITRPAAPPAQEELYKGRGGSAMKRNERETSKKLKTRFDDWIFSFKAGGGIHFRSTTGSV